MPIWTQSNNFILSPVFLCTSASCSLTKLSLHCLSPSCTHTTALATPSDEIRHSQGSMATDLYLYLRSFFTLVTALITHRYHLLTLLHLHDAITVSLFFILTLDWALLESRPWVFLESSGLQREQAAFKMPLYVFTEWTHRSSAQQEMNPLLSEVPTYYKYATISLNLSYHILPKINTLYLFKFHL